MTQEQAFSSQTFISAYLNLLRHSLTPPPVKPVAVSETLPLRHQASSACALVFMPHPDDECLTAALPLRLKQEQGWQIINVAVTLGSNLERRVERKDELAKACAVLGFDCLLPIEDGFSAVSYKTRHEDSRAWDKMTRRVASIITHYNPQAIFMPHQADWNSTHIGTHYLVLDALGHLDDNFMCTVFQTEYWQPLEEPNRMIGINESDAVKILMALTCHKGEVARNPYDRGFPAFLTENVRRGSERMAGKGAQGAAMDFAMMYGAALYQNGRLIPSALKRVLGAQDDLASLF